MTTPKPGPLLSLVRLDQLQDHPLNPRRGAGAEDVADLVASIRAQGLLQPIVVRPVDDEGHGLPLERVHVRLQVLAGHRRTAALRIIHEGDGAARVPALVMEADDARALELVLAENAHHRDVDPFLEGQAVEAALDAHQGNVQELARLLGLPVRWVAARRNLRNLSSAWQDRIRNREPWRSWPVFVVEELVTLAPDAQDGFMRDHAKELGGPGGPPPRTWWTAELAAWTRELTRAPFDVTDASLVKAAGACGSCPFTSMAQPGLFDDGAPCADGDAKALGRCLNAPCWDRKVTAAARARLADARDRVWKEEGAASPFVAAAVVLPKDAAKPAPKGLGYVLPPQAYRLVKKGEKGARPALDIHGDLAEVLWIVPTPESAARLDGTREKAPKAATPAAAAPAAKSPADVLKELEAQHQARVEGDAVLRLLERMGTLKLVEDVSELSVRRLAGIFGVVHVDPCPEEVLKVLGQPAESRRAARVLDFRLWAAIVKAVDTGLAHAPDGFWRKAAPLVAKELGLDWKYLLGKADMELEPTKELKVARTAAAAAAAKPAGSTTKKPTKKGQAAAARAKRARELPQDKAARRKARAAVRKPDGKRKGPRTSTQAAALADLKDRQAKKAGARAAASAKGARRALGRPGPMSTTDARMLKLGRGRKAPKEPGRVLSTADGSLKPAWTPEQEAAGAVTGMDLASGRDLSVELHEGGRGQDAVAAQPLVPSGKARQQARPGARRSMKDRVKAVERKPRKAEDPDAPLVPKGGLKPDVVAGALCLAACPDGKARDGGEDGAALASWTPDQLGTAYDWAMREHLGASDNPDVKRRPCPEHVLALPALPD